MSIAVSPATASVNVGATQPFTATATYSDNSTASVTATATWTSSSAATATVTSAGVATGVAAGTATITASLNGISSTAKLTVVAAAATVSSIAITPAASSITAGTTQQFTATATYSDNSTANVTSTATWTSSTAATATVNSAGLATGIAAGTATITASFKGITSTAALTVTAVVPPPPPTVTSIAVTPPTASVAIGATQQYAATATYSDGSTKNVTTTATWVSAAPATATVNAAGLATGVGAGTTGITASLSGVDGTAQITVMAPTKTLTSIAISPTSTSFAVGSTQQYTATATYSDGSTANVSSTATWTSSNTSVATIDSSGLATGVASGSTTISAALNSVTGSTPASVTTASSPGVNITTWHVDANRSGLNSSEQTLTPTNVNAQSFGKLFSLLVDGYVYGEPLIMSNVTINGAKHNVVYVATEKDSVYAFDADSYGNGTPLWHVSLLQSGETPLTNAPIQPYQGVTATPVIDPSTNTIYVVSTETNGQSGGSTFRLHALDITTGAEKFGGPVDITASVPGTNTSNGIGDGKTVTLNTGCMSRAALLLANGNVYIGIGSCPTGWLLAYNASTLAQVAVWNASPNLPGEGQYASAGGIWMGSGGPVADSSGNIYVTTGNGPWDGKTAWGDSIIKFSPTLQIEDYFTPQDYNFMDCDDSDLAAGGLLLIPGTTELLAGGKMGKLYLVNSGNLGHEQANDAGATQTLYFESDLSAPYTGSCTDPSNNTYTAQISSYEIFGTPAYYNGYVYLGITPTGSSTPAGMRQFQYNGKLTPGAYTTPSIQENTRGTTPFISSNGSQNGIVWMIDEGMPLQQGTATNATLRAYDADEFPNELYNSSQNSADVPGYGIKFTSPVVANGKVYISTGHDMVSTANPQGEIDVYGLH